MNLYDHGKLSLIMIYTISVVIPSSSLNTMMKKPEVRFALNEETE